MARVVPLAVVRALAGSTSGNFDDCAVCGLGDSKDPSNDILFCDGCDVAFHQRTCCPTTTTIVERTNERTQSLETRPSVHHGSD